MSEDYKDIILSQIRKEVMLNSLAKGKRFDGRAFDEMRKIEVQQGSIATAEGSALVNLGGTRTLVALKFAVVEPFSDRPEEGVFATNAELTPLASSSFEGGPPDENSIELARVVDRAIRSSETLNLDSFFIENGKVLALYADIYVLDHSGNYLDASSIAAAAALLNAKMPKIENGEIIRGEYTGKLKLTSVPVCTTTSKIGDYWLADPSRDEELITETRLTIGTTEKHVCAIQKGTGYLNYKELMDNIDVAFKRGNDIRNMLKSF